MFHIILQIWGGGFYLLNKIFFSQAERSKDDVKQKWLVRSWAVYLIGLPAWLVIFVLERNWIVFAVEAGGATGMVLGLMIAKQGIGNEPKWLDYITRVAVVMGIGVSLYDFGGITTINQVLELGTIVGFLFGTYLLAKQKASGYLWFILMNGSMGTLLAVQNYFWLVLQQALSLIFVLDAYRMNKRNKAHS